MNVRRLLPYRIERRFLMLVIPVIALVTLGYCAGLLALRAMELRQRIIDEAALETASDARFLQSPLWDLDLETVDSAVQRIAKRARVDCVALTIAEPLNQSLRYGHCPVRAGQALLTSDILRQTDEEQSMLLGRLQIWVDSEVTPAQIVKDAGPFLQLLLILLLGLTLSLGWAFRRIVLRPLQRVRTSMRIFRDSGRRVPVDWGAADELGDFIKEYNAGLQREQSLADQSRQSHADLTALGDIGRELAATLDPEDAMRRLHQRVDTLLDAHVFAVAILDTSRSRLVMEFVVEAGKRLAPIEFSLEEAGRPAVWCVRNKRELAVGSLDELSAMLGSIAPSKAGLPMASVVYLPLRLGDQVLGCLSVQSPRTDAYSERQLEILRALSSSTAVALANARSYRELRLTLQKLQQAQQQLLINEKLSITGQLTAGVAHEINNPTNFAHVAAQNMQARLAQFHAFLLQLAGPEIDGEVGMAIEQKIAELDADLAIVLDGNRRIAAIVRDLRAFSRLDEAERKPVSIVSSLQSTLNLVRAQYGRDVEFALELAADPEIECYPARLNQVFMNLIVNACQAIVSRKRKEDATFVGRLRVSSRIEASALLIEFTDNGSGMSAAVRARIFEPFFTTKAAGEGTGLGLPTSHAIVTDHGGRIEVFSVEGEGTLFCVRLPLQSGARASAPGRAEDEA